MNDLRTTPTSPEHFERARTRVRIFTASGLVEGDYSHAPGVRLSDSLRNAATNERYMLLTDVTIAGTHAAADDAAARAPFVLLNAAHASVIIPLEDA